MSEENIDEIIGDSGRRPRPSRRAVYLFLSFEAVITCAFLFVKVFLVDLKSSQVTLALAIVVNTVLLSLAYHNLTFAKAARIRHVTKPPTKGSFKGKQKDYDAAVKAFEGKITQASLWYSCAYNNAIFMIVTPLLGVYVMSEKLSGELNLLVSGAAAAALAIYNSNTALKAIGELQK